MTSSALFQVNNQEADIPNTNQHNFKFYIAIDFGTDGACLAYADEENTYIHEEFESSRYGRTAKPKTIILLNEKGEYESFGMNAKITYMTLNNAKKNEWMLFDRFKMSLYGMTIY